jgi:ATP-dependent helicase/DNAse subunit B
VCLAGVNKVKLGFTGIVEHAEPVPGVKAFDQIKESGEYANWDDLKNAWKQRLELLAEEIQQGRAEVKPRDNKVCTYCPLPSLCRIHEWGEEQ